MIIDFHTHIFPDEVAERATQALAFTYDISLSFDGTKQGLLNSMNASGVDKSVILPVATKPEQVRSINTWVAKQSSERIVPFGAMHPDFPEIQEETARMRSLGLKGIKLQPNWQGFYPDEDKMMPVYEAAADNNLIVIFHSGLEIGDKMTITATPERIAKVKKLFPNLKMVVAHMGGHLMWDEVRKCLLGQDVWLDTSFCLDDELPDTEMLDMIRAHGAEKILVGSDCPCGFQAEQIGRITRLTLSDHEKEMICGGNAAILLGLN